MLRVLHAYGSIDKRWWACEGWSSLEWLSLRWAMTTVRGVGSDLWVVLDCANMYYMFIYFTFLIKYLLKIHSLLLSVWI
jgi:hypothetical protein